jgi:hypothetical protein
MNLANFIKPSKESEEFYLLGHTDPLTANAVLGVVSQETELFITSAVKTSNIIISF